MTPRFFVPQPLHTSSEVSLPENVVHHLRVLRLGTNALITLFNGSGGEYHAHLGEIGKRSATAYIFEFTPCERELSFQIVLAQAIAAGEKMDWLIEKAVELGVAAIQPLHTTRSLVRLTDERAKRRVTHWQALIHSACEQCGRNQVPPIYLPQTLNDWLSESALETAILLSPQAQTTLPKVIKQIKKPKHITLLVGSEAGFTYEEEANIQKHGFQAASLGNRILRCETAGLVAIAKLTALIEV